MYDDFFLDAASDDLVRREGVLLDNTSSVRSDSSRLDMLAAAVTKSNHLQTGKKSEVQV